MPTWQKIIVSGSDATLNTVTTVTGVSVGTNQVISASQSTTKLTGSFSGSFKGDGSQLTNLSAASLPAGVVSASSQYPGWVTASSQIVWSEVNYNQGIVSSSTQVKPLLPDGTVSSSAQYPGWVTASSQIDIIQTTNYSTFSSSLATVDQNQQSQINALIGATSSYAINSTIQSQLAGVVSSSTQVKTLLPDGTVSSSTQTIANIAGQDIAPANISASGAISGASIQVSGNGTVGGNLTVTGTLTATSQSIQYISSSQLNVATNKIIVNTDNSLRFGGISVVDSGSAGNSGSLFWDSQNDRWVYEDVVGGQYTSAILIAGPKNTGATGNERGLLEGRVPVASGDDHIDTAAASSSIRVDFPSRLTHVEAGLFITGNLTANGTVTLQGIPSSSAQVKTLLPDGTVSSSAQYPGWITASSQVVWSQVNYNTGIVSSSTQFTSLTEPFTGSFTGSFIGDGSNLTGIVTNLNITGSDGGTGTVSLKTQALTIDGTNGLTATISGQTITISGSDATTSTKGVASFSPTFFTTAGGVVSISASGITPTELNTSVAGTGLSGGGGTALSVQYGSTSGTAVQGNTNITINGTTNEIAITGTAAQALGGSPSYTIGLPSAVSITNLTAATASVSSNLVVGGDLVVNGTTTTLNTTNVLIEDRYLLLNSGSVAGAPAQGGIVVQDGGTASGSAMLYSTENAKNRWGVAENVAANATTATQTAYVATVTDMNVAAHASAVATYEKPGNIKIDTNGDIYIWA